VPAGGTRAVAVVLTGGAGRRFGGDKTAAPLGARSVLEHLLAGLPEGLPVVLVGPDPGPGLRARPWRTVREHPAGGGPAAGLAAACAQAPPGTRTVVALAGDQPFAGTAVHRLLDVLAGPAAPDDAPDDAGPDGAIGLDPSGRHQPLLAAYRLAALRAALGPDPAGRPLREVLSGLRLVEVPVSATEALDVDTPADLARARDVLADLDPPGPPS